MNLNPIGKLNPLKRPDLSRLLRREKWMIYGAALLVVLAAFFVASRFLRPPPQKNIAISAGAEGGAYYRYAQRYRDILKREGITLEVKTSAGSLQNLQRLRGDKPEVAVALVQGGTTAPEDSNGMLSLGRMFYEPVWVFHRLAPDAGQLTQLKGKKVNVGPKGSGTQQLVQQMLKVNDIGRDNTTLLELGSKEAQQALIAGEIDAAFFVAAPDADIVQALLRAPGIHLMSLTHAEAYAKRHPYLARIVLHKGVIDFVNNVPGRDIELVAAIAMLAVRADQHPALQYILTEAAAEVHRQPSIFYPAKYFPQGTESELPVSEVADRFYKNGPPFLQRYLPFWLAVLLEQLMVLLIPVVTILYPIIKIVPELLDWRVHKRLYHWYNELKKLERAMVEAPGDREKHLAEITRIDEAVQDIPVPVKFSEQHFNLRANVGYVQRRLETQPGVASTASPAA